MLKDRHLSFDSIQLGKHVVYIHRLNFFFIIFSKYTLPGKRSPGSGIVLSYYSLLPISLNVVATEIRFILENFLS